MNQKLKFSNIKNHKTQLNPQFLKSHFASKYHHKDVIIFLILDCWEIEE